MARTYSCEAIVLKGVNFGESDRLITFLAKYKGKFTGVAKGVRKVASRRGPNLDLLNQVKAHFADGKNFDVVTEVQTIETFRAVKESLEKIGYGFYLAEVTNEFLEEGQGGRDVFDLLLQTLHLLQSEKESEKVKVFLFAFDMKLLEAVGYKPQLSACAKCSGPLNGTRTYLVPQVGGAATEECRSGSLFTKPMSNDALKLLRFLQKEDYPTIKRFSPKPSLNKEVEGLLRFYIEYLLEKDLKSAKFIEQIRG